MFNFIFTANVKALNDIWLIGDIFLQEMIATLQNMRHNALVAKKTPPYMYERFNVHHFYQSRLTLDTFTRLQNAFIDAFNRQHHLPSYIMILADNDLINAADFFNFGVSKLLGITLNWLAKQLERMIESRKEKLSEERPGAISSIETKIIWVKMIERPPVPLNDKRYKTQVTCGKFNATLNNLTDWRLNTFVTSISSLNLDRDFDFVGNMKESGKQQFWRELDHYFKRFDRDGDSHYIQTNQGMQLAAGDGQHHGNQPHHMLVPKRLCFKY